MSSVVRTGRPAARLFGGLGTGRRFPGAKWNLFPQIGQVISAMLSGPTRIGSISQTSVNCLPHSAQTMTNSNGTGHSRERIHGTGPTGRHGKMLMTLG